MPISPNAFINSVKSVVVFVHLVIFSQYMSMRHKRYLDEWIGSFIYVIGDAIDMGFGVIQLANIGTAEDKAKADFIRSHIFTRAFCAFV